MNSGKRQLLTAIRWTLSAILLATATKFYFHKLHLDTSAPDATELRRICGSITGCKSIALKARSSAQYGHDILSIEAVADRRYRSESLPKLIEREVQKAWQVKSTIFSAPWNKHALKVAYE